MVQGSRGTGFAGSAFVRLLARMAGDAIAESPQGFAQRLGQWVRWTDAISLSAALNAGPPSAPAARPRGVSTAGFERELMGLREALARSIGDDAALKGEALFLPHRRHYLGKQQSMDMAITPLRERLRAALAVAPRIAPLAGLDAAMAAVLAGQERSLFASVPVLLERHFERLRPAPEAAAPDGIPVTAALPWVDSFRADMRQLLLAELDLRLQPVEGLLDALRAALPAPEAPPVTSL